MQHTDFKICMLTSSHIALDQRIFYKQALSLAGVGYRVSVVGQHDRAETVESVRIIPLPAAVTRLRRYLASARVLVLAFRQKAHIFHFHDPELVPVGLVLKLFGRKVIYDSHEDYEQTLLYWDMPRFPRWLLASLWRCFERVASIFFDHIITADSHVQSKFPKSKATVIANYVPLRFAENCGEKPQDGVFRIMYTGTVEYERGVGKVVEALDYVKADPLEFHVVGEANKQSSLRQLLLGHPKVVCHGKVPWEMVSSHLARGDVGVALYQPVPTFTYCPGDNAVKLFEYMVFGLPVIVSNFPRLKKYIESLGCGVAVDPTDPKEIAKAIDYLHDNPHERQKLGDTGRKLARSRYNWEHEQQKLLAVYESLLVDARHDSPEVSQENDEL